MGNKEIGLFNSIFSELTPADIAAGNLRAQISGQIRRKRVELGLSQSEFSKLLDIPRNIIEDWESFSYDFPPEVISFLKEKHIIGGDI